MNLDQIETKCFILALFIRDDGERFLLGSRAYEFVDSQLHFVANSYQNDIVEVQGNDGVMLAGQVRRGTSQPFDGYIGDQTVDRSTIEQYRRDFMKFFRKNHYYKVVYVFPDGSAVQRRNGFIVEAPEVKELYQLFPQYHISMNFEDINYYAYEEDSEGEEIYGESAILKIATSATGGLIWVDDSPEVLDGEGSNFTLDGTVGGNAISNVQLKGDTTQQTYSGKNLFNGQTEQGTFNSSGQKTPNASKYRNVSPIAVSANTTYAFSAVGITAWDLFTYDSNNNYLGYGYSGNGIYTFGNNVAYVNFAINAVNGAAPADIQVEKNSSITAFEPYVGGIPAPNPDYPQEVQTATGRQMVEVYGKNLFDKTSVTNPAYFNSDGTIATGSTATPWSITDYISIQPNKTYTLSGSTTGFGNVPSRCYYDSDKNFITGVAHSNANPFTNVAPANAYYMRESFRTADISTIQIEEGSTATSYQTHQSYEVNLGKNLLDPSILIQGHINGGTPTNRVCTRSGDDIYVSGGDTYTISVSDISIQVNVYGYKSINGTAIYESGWQSMPFTFELPSQANYLRLMFRYSNDSDIVPSDIICQLEKGSTATTYAPYFTPIELCKIGTYQDYIYKSGDDWYIHKEINNRTLDGTEANWGITSRTNGYQFSVNNPGQKIGNNSKTEYFCNNFEGIPFSQRDTHSESIYTYSGDTVIRILTNVASSVAAFKTWLGSHNTNVYYILATATDTQITDSSLVAQLEALLGATTYDGQTVFTVTSENQLAILSLSTIGAGGGGVVWDENGAEWEEGTGGGPTTITVDSIDNVYPVWELTGPSVNPQLSVLTTNTTLSYSGTVTASQTLKVDMFNKTATLNGASVIGNVSGDWVYLKPGLNRVTYTTNNADASDSTIWWQEIVG